MIAIDTDFVFSAQRLVTSPATALRLVDTVAVDMVDNKAADTTVADSVVADVVDKPATHVEVSYLVFLLDTG